MQVCVLFFTIKTFDANTRVQQKKKTEIKNKKEKYFFTNTKKIF